MSVRNARTGSTLGGRVRVADDLVGRLRGLLGRPEPASGEGLLIVPCSGVHMLGMRYALDVAFLDRDGRVVRTRERLGPGQMVPWVRGAHSAVELPCGALAATETRVGDQLRVEAAA